MNRILLVQQNWLGDALFATPAVRALRKKYPEAYIACLAPARVRDVFAHNPFVNEVIVYDDRAAVLSPSFWRTVSLLRSKRFDLAVLFHGSKTKARLARWAGIAERWGYGEGRERLLTRSVPAPKEKLHKIDWFLRLTEGLGVPSDGRFMDFHPAEGAVEKLAALLKGYDIGPGDPYAVVHAGGNWDLKRWPVDYFSQWVYFFLEAGYGKVVLCGSASEERAALKIASHFSPERVVSLCGKTTVDTLALLLRGARVVLSNDSGPIHLAASQRAPIVGLFGPTSIELTGPVSEGPMRLLHVETGCRVPCYYRSCNYRVCMDFLRPQYVFDESRKLLETR